MAERKLHGYTLAEAVVVCPECQMAFCKEVLVDTPPITSEDTIEADLHRVFPSAELRAALLALCPNCKYCTWTGMFAGHNINPAIVQKEPGLDYTKKYALAVKCARSKGQHALDIAFLALNGLWCAREANESDQLWLELAAYEHSRGMPENSPRPDEDGLTHLLMAEIWRQLGQFDKAIPEYEMSLADPTILASIVQHQSNLARRGIASPTALPLHVVKQLFQVLEITEPDSIEVGTTLVAESAARATHGVAPTAAPTPGAASPGAQAASAALSPAASAATAMDTQEPADDPSAHMFSAMATILAATASIVESERDSAKANAKAVPAGSDAAGSQVAGQGIAPAGSQACKQETQCAAAKHPEIKQVKTTTGPLLASLEQARSAHMKRFRPAQGQEITAGGWVSDYNPAVPTVPSPASGVAEPVISTPVIGPNPNAVPPVSSNPYGSAAENPYKDAINVAPHAAAHASPSDYGLRGADAYADPTNSFADFSENPNPKSDPLPDIDIDDPFGELARRKRSAPVQPQQPQDPSAQPPAQQPAAAQSNNASDAIARVESYLSFSRALHTRSWMRGMGN